MSILGITCTSSVMHGLAMHHLLCMVRATSPKSCACNLHCLGYALFVRLDVTPARSCQSVRHLHQLGYAQLGNMPSVIHGVCHTDRVMCETCTASVMHCMCGLMRHQLGRVDPTRHLHQLGYARFVTYHPLCMACVTPTEPCM